MTVKPEETKTKEANAIPHQPQTSQPENGVQSVGVRHRHSSVKAMLQSGDGVSVESVPSVSVDRTLPEEHREPCLLEPSKKAFGASRFLKLSTWLSITLIFRLLLLGFSVWQDTTRWPDGELRFTDVDYDVFTDAAQALLNGENMYEARPTYRYSPLIACLLVPGHWLFRANQSSSWLAPAGVQYLGDRTLNFRTELARMWGKLMFILADLGCACFQYAIIQQEAKLTVYAQLFALNQLRLDANRGSQSKAGLAVPLIVFAWLFNPVTAVVSVRGNAEAVLGMCILACLYAILTDRLMLAGCLFGLSIHMKLYPVIYGPAIYLWLVYHHKVAVVKTDDQKNRWSSLFDWLPNRRHFVFGLTSLVSLSTLTGVCYRYFGGMQFLRQAYLYHFTRTDIKHNFAPHFYPLYLLSGSLWRVNQTQQSLHVATGGKVNWQLVHRLTSALDSLTSGWFSAESGTGPAGYSPWDFPAWIFGLYRFFSWAIMLPALFLVVGLSLKLYRWPSLCWLVITHAFITFNKVCTSQYFLWSLVLLPPTLANVRLSPGDNQKNLLYRLVFSCVLIWFGAQIVWLSAAYVLEMCTASTSLVAEWSWRAVWAASLLYVAANVGLLQQLIVLRGSPLAPLSACKAAMAGDSSECQPQAHVADEEEEEKKKDR